jgi:plasmid stability protein
MANLTITVDDDLLRRARVRAIEQGTSVNAVLRDYLESYAGLGAERQEAAQAILELSERAKSKHEGARWTRDELYGR